MDNVDIIHPLFYYTTKFYIRICQIITSFRLPWNYTSHLFAINGTAEILREAYGNFLDNDAYKWEIKLVEHTNEQLIFQIDRQMFPRNSYDWTKNKNDTQFWLFYRIINGQMAIQMVFQKTNEVASDSYPKDILLFSQQPSNYSLSFTR